MKLFFYYKFPSKKYFFWIWIELSNLLSQWLAIFTFVLFDQSIFVFLVMQKKYCACVCLEYLKFTYGLLARLWSVKHQLEFWIRGIDFLRLSKTGWCNLGFDAIDLNLEIRKNSINTLLSRFFLYTLDIVYQWYTHMRAFKGKTIFWGKKRTSILSGKGFQMTIQEGKGPARI